MIIEIGGKKYNFEVNGTVGLTYIAERYLEKGESLDISKPSHIALLYYAALFTSNKDCPSKDDFLSKLTANTLKKMATYFNERWKELDPQLLEEANSDGDPSGNA